MNTDFKRKQKLAQSFIKHYLTAKQDLIDLGIMRSERNLQGEYAEWLVANIFNLKLASSTVYKAIDATDNQGNSYQIKSRVVESLIVS